MSQTLPSTCDPLHHLDSEPFAKQQYAHVASPTFINVVDHVFLTAEQQWNQFVSCDPPNIHLVSCAVTAHDEVCQVPRCAVPGTLTVCRSTHQHHEAPQQLTSNKRHEYASSLEVWDHATKLSSQTTWSYLWRFCAIDWPLSSHESPDHAPNPATTIVADDLNNVSSLVLCVWSCNNGDAFLLPLHSKLFNGVRHVTQNTSQVIHCTSHRVPDLHFSSPHQMSHDASFGLSR